jgi:hypothetical protein
MTGIKEGQPFSATYNKLRGVAGGMTYGKSDTEFKDNSFDEGATYSNTKIAIIDGRYHIVNIDDGKGAPSLPHLFGLGEAMPRKTDEKTCGLFNHGHTAAIAFHNPEIVYSESRQSDGRFGTLMFNSGEFANEIDKSEGNLRNANVLNYLNSNKERTESQGPLIKKCMESIKDPIMNKQLEDILLKKAKSYMLNILKLSDRSESPDENYKAFIANERMYYHDLLKAGRTISLETSDGKKEIASAENAIDPLSNRKKFPVLESVFEIRRSEKLIGKLTLKNADSADTRVLYVSYDLSDRRRKYPVVTETCPAEWDSAQNLITLYGFTNAISELEENKQLAELYNQQPVKGRVKKSDNGFKGSDFKGVDDIRGVLFHFVHRILGKPYWRTGSQDTLGWGAERNSGHPRCYVKAEGDKKIIAELLGLQSNKHNTDFDKCDPLIHRFLFCIFGIIVHKYTSCTLNNSDNPITKGGNTKPWDLNDLVCHIMGRPVRRPAPAPGPVPVPGPAPGNAFGARPKSVVAPSPVVAPIVAPSPEIAPVPVSAPVVAPVPVSSPVVVPIVAPVPVSAPVVAPSPVVSPTLVVTPVPVPIPTPVPAPVSVLMSMTNDITVRCNATHIFIYQDGAEIRIPYNGNPSEYLETVCKRWIRELKN